MSPVGTNVFFRADAIFRSGAESIVFQNVLPADLASREDIVVNEFRRLLALLEQHVAGIDARG
jgi:hypothetical protein